MINKLFNPFRLIAGWNSLIIGILIILATSFTGFLSNTHFPDVISVKTSPDYPLQYYVIQNLTNWVIISAIMYLISIIFSPSKVRIIDIAGTQALARFPYLIAAFTGFSKSLKNLGEYILWHYLKQGESVEVNAATITIAISLIILTLLLTIWLIVLMYNAFKVSANLKGAKSVILFITGLLISIFISALFTNKLIQIL